MSISVNVKDYICTITIDKPPANATSREDYIGLRDTIFDIEERDDIKVVILTGAGKIFMGGSDLGEICNFQDRKACIEYMDTIRNAYLSVKYCKYPVICAVNGAAIGAGFAFAACCDLVVAAEGAKFGLPEARLGIVAADGFASMMIPEKVLRYLVFTGTPISAEEIKGYGGIHKVVPFDKVMDEAVALANEIMAGKARRTLILWKQCLNKNYDHQLEKKFDNNRLTTAEYYGFHDFKESAASFMEKRKPDYDEK